jgi:TonB-dependent receptor
MRQRSFSARVFGYVKFNSRNFDLDETMDANSIYAQDNISKTGFILQEGTNKSDAYDGTSTLHAAYVMADQNIFKKLKIVYGFRAEHFNQQLNSFKGLDPITINTSKVDILPSINASITLSEKSKLRLAASNTLSRPEFREIAPFNFYDFAQAFEVGGNPNLSRTSILNYDLRFEHYFGGSQLFSASLFYKDFTDPIEQVTGSDITSGSIATSYANAISAKNYGFEIEVRRNLDFLLHDVKANFENWKNYFFMFANYAWIRSEVDVSNVPGAETRPLQGQSPYVINAGVNFNDPERQISGGLSFNQVGKRIVFVGTDVFPDLYEKARSVIDMQITSRMAKQGKMKNVVIKLQARDILSQNIIIYQNLNMNNTNYEAGKSTEFRLTNPGRNAKISISYTF